MLRTIFALIFSLCFLSACGERGRFATEQTLGKQAVIGGEEVAEDDDLTLSVVALRDKDSRDNVCTGTLLTSRIVLTAAHCVEEYLTNNEELEIVLGHSSWEVNNGEVFVAEKIIGHPQYFDKAKRAESGKVIKDCGKGGCDVKTMARIDQGDIALIRLKGEVPARMVPVTLNKKTHAYDNGTEALVVGFGQHSLEDAIDTGFLRRFNAPVYRRYEKVDLTTFKKLAIPSTKQTGACFGDSGGPAFVQIGGKQVQVGIAQAAIDIDPKKEYACGFKALAFTDVAAHLLWINQTRAELEKTP